MFKISVPDSQEARHTYESSLADCTDELQDPVLSESYCFHVVAILKFL